MTEGFGTKYKKLLENEDTKKTAEHILGKYLTLLLADKKRQLAFMQDCMAAIERAYDLMLEGGKPRLVMLNPMDGARMSRPVVPEHLIPRSWDASDGLPALLVASKEPKKRRWDVELFFDNSLALECNKQLKERFDRVSGRKH